jgi:hypothetical protein
VKIISFAYTTPALLAGAKTVTRRDWNAEYAQSFRRGEVVQAYDRNPRFHGKHVANIRLTEGPPWEAMHLMPDSDYIAEGFAWLHEHQDQISQAGRRVFGTFSFADFERWRQQPGGMWVVRFELVEVLG